MVTETDAPKVKSTHTSGHVADKVEPLAVGRYAGVGKSGKGVFRDVEHGGLAPRSIAALGRGYLCIAGIAGVGLTDGEVHRLEVGREGAGTFVFLGVQFAVNRFGLRPLALVVLL